MKRVKTNIQDGWLLRNGFMGRWLTVYSHTFSGADEVSERFHAHPWLLTISVVLRGGYCERLSVPGGFDKVKFRNAFNIHWYRSGVKHRIETMKPGTRTLFFGFGRTQKMAPYATEETPYGYAHYSECRDVPIAEVPTD